MKKKIGQPKLPPIIVHYETIIHFGQLSYYRIRAVVGTSLRAICTWCVIYDKDHWLSKIPTTPMLNFDS